MFSIFHCYITLQVAINSIGTVKVAAVSPVNHTPSHASFIRSSAVIQQK